MKERPKRLSGDTVRVPLPSKVHPDIKKAVEQVAQDDESTLSNTIERLLAQSPRVKRRLTAEVVPA